MADPVDVARVQEELVAAVKQGDEAHARELVAKLGVRPRQARTVLETMLKHPDGLVRLAAAFGLGELGGAPSVRCLEEQLAKEEARRDHDGAAVVEEITRALGRIKGAGARAILVRRLERLAASRPERSQVSELAHALWKRRHPDLIPVVRRSLEKISLPAPHALHGLLVLLEESPEALADWARDPSVPLEYKMRVLAVAEEDVPDTLVPALHAFIATAQTVSEKAVREDREAAYYCERLFSVLLQDQQRFVVEAPEEVRSELRALTLRLVAATSMGCALRAASVLELVGRPEDAAMIEAHIPEDPTFAKVFNDVARVLRGLQKN